MVHNHNHLLLVRENRFLLFKKDPITSKLITYTTNYIENYIKFVKSK